MRIKQEIVDFTLAYVKNNFTGAKVYLFGSRTDDNKKGGDIDILILSKERLSISDLSKLRIELYKKIGEQKIDLVNYTFNDKNPFKDIVLEFAVEL